MKRHVLGAFLVLAACASPLAALNGVYTCANGNPGNAYDYGDIGDFFTALETQGMTGPVTLNIFDDGGVFTSKSSYELGYWQPLSGLAIAGLSAANPLVIRAAPSEQPVITGSGPFYTSTTQGALKFGNMGYTTIEGLTIRNAQNFGIFWGSTNYGTNNFEAVRIARCRISDIADGNAIIFTPNSLHVAPGPFTAPNGVIIENNMIWNCTGHMTGPGFKGAIGAFSNGQEWIVRHNTVIHSAADSGAAAFCIYHPVLSRPIEEFHSNIVYFSNPSAYSLCLSFSELPQFADYNIYHYGPTVQFGGIQLAPAGTFAQWQGLGMDAHGLVVDPQLVNTLPGFEDLHLRSSSPAINMTPINSVAFDNEGEARPFGGGFDVGADEYVPPDMFVEYGVTPVPSVSAVNVGPILPPGALRVFTVRNLGAGRLIMGGTPPVVLIPGANCGPATAVQVQPATLVMPAGFTTFTLFVQPAALGPMDFVISINNTDPVKSPYVITINAMGVPAPPPNQPAVAISLGGSTLLGPVNGPFSCTLVPGAQLANATIELHDVDLDAITVQGIALFTAAPLGITPPAIPAPGQPLTLTWTGVVNPANPPGLYLWRVLFKDAVNGASILCDIQFTITDLPPVHQGKGGIGGNGTPIAPYTVPFNRGDDASVVVAIADISDPNAAQALTLGPVIKLPGNPGGVGFTVTFAGGVLSVAPGVMLKVAETGQHRYDTSVSDGIHVVPIALEFTVVNTPFSITTVSPLPDAQGGQFYSATIQVAGAVGGLAFSVSAGALPDNTTLNGATGQISGTPTLGGTASFTISVHDATTAQASKAFEVTVIVPPPNNPTPPGSPDSGNGCAGTPATTLPGWALLALAAMRRRRAAHPSR